MIKFSVNFTKVDVKDIFLYQERHLADPILYYLGIAIGLGIFLQSILFTSWLINGSPYHQNKLDKGQSNDIQYPIEYTIPNGYYITVMAR